VSGRHPNVDAAGILAQVAEAHGWDVRLTESSDCGSQFTFDGVSHVVGTSTRE